MVCVNIHNCFYICTHTDIIKRKMFPYPLASSATAKNTAERKMNVATQKHCIVCRIVAYLFSKSSLSQNKTDPTITSFVHKENKEIRSFGSYFL